MMMSAVHLISYATVPGACCHKQTLSASRECMGQSSLPADLGMLITRFQYHRQSPIRASCTCVDVTLKRQDIPIHTVVKSMQDWILAQLHNSFMTAR